MRIIVAIRLLWAMPAYADWQYTKWGMTPEQVVDASGGSGSKIPLSQQGGKSRLGFTALLVGRYTLGDFSFDLDFQFAKTGLEMVAMELTPYSYDRCKRLENTMLSKYGSPFEGERGDSLGPLNTRMVWHDRQGGNSVLFSNVREVKVCHVTYERLESARGL
jgi:hypothetical protein